MRALEGDRSDKLLHMVHHNKNRTCCRFIVWFRLATRLASQGKFNG